MFFFLHSIADFWLHPGGQSARKGLRGFKTDAHKPPGDKKRRVETKWTHSSSSSTSRNSLHNRFFF